MSNLPFRSESGTPKREYRGPELNNYRGYKPFLRKDFKRRCGYTNCGDFWFGGVSTFQIDHFLPVSKYPKLKTKYSNLVYCCSYVNRAKSDDEGNYIDPCNNDYNRHFVRNEKGEILPDSSSPGAVYMHKKLKLYLKRYSIIWMLEQLEDRMEALISLIELSDNDEAKNLFVEVTKNYMAYKRYLRAEQ